MKVAFFAVAALVFLLPVHSKPLSNEQNAPDTSLGRPIKIITTEGQFVTLDKNNPDRFFFKDQSSMMTLNLIFGAPEMDCFLANHKDDNVRLTYAIYDRNTLSGHERLNYAQRIVSLKSGDDTKDWAQKEQRDSSLLRDHHEKLARLRAGKLY